MKKLFVPLGLVALVASSAFAQTPAPAAAPAAAPTAAATHAARTMSPAGQLIERMLEPLNLTPEQHTQAAAMREKFEAATDGLRADLRAGFMQLRRLRGSAGDPVEAEAKRKELAGLQEQLRGELE
jgi:Spy/CpxP family protein refolding chaperone